MDKDNTKDVLKGFSEEPKKFPIKVRQMTDKETKEYHLKRIADLSQKSKQEGKSK